MCRGRGPNSIEVTEPGTCGTLRDVQKAQGTWWERLVAPHPAVTEIGERRRAQLLSTLLLIIIGLGLASGVVQLATIPSFVSTFIVMLGALVVLFLAYVLSRSAHPSAAAWVASLAPIAACIAVAVENPDDRVWYAFMMVGVLLASVFLSPRAAATVGAIAVASVVGVVLGVDGMQHSDRYLPPLMFHAVFTPLLVVAAHHRNRVEAERIEARVALEEKLRESRRLEVLGQMAGSIAHDFNNLLAIAYANVGLARRRSGGNPEIDEIESVCKRSTALTQQLLAFVRRQAVDPVVLDVRPIVERLEPLLRRLLGPSVKLQISAANDLASVRADPTQLEQILLNLAANARDATGGEGTVTIDQENAERNGDSYVLVSVRDDGEGMDEDTAKRIFEPLFTTKEGTGTGLGLATVHGLVLQSGGLIEVESAPGQGSCFRVLLPAVAVSRDDSRES